MTEQPRAVRVGAHRAPSSGRRRLLWSVALLAVLALAVAFLLTLPGGDDPGSAEPPARDTGAAATDPEAALDPDAAALTEWARTQLAEDTGIAVPDGVRADTLTAGIAEDRLLPPDSDAPGSLRVVEGAPPAGAVVLARFGDAAGLSLVDPAPGRPTPEELGRRQRLSRAVLANPGVGATGRAADVLRSGDVDARLLGLLAGLVAQLGIGIGDFPLPPGAPADGPPSRTVLIDRSGGTPLQPGSRDAERLMAYLDAQLPPFAPDTVEVTDEGVLVGFHYESAPDALVGAATP